MTETFPPSYLEGLCFFSGKEIRKFPGSLVPRPNTWSSYFCLSYLGFRGSDSVLDTIPVT